METIKELRNKEEWLSAYPVMHQLRVRLDETAYLEFVAEASRTEEYHLFALVANGRIVSVTGFMPMTTLYYGKFVWVCDLVTDEAERSKGYGRKLLEFVQNWAADHHLETVALSSGLQRKEAHRFYQEKMDFDKVSYVFKKIL
ncbi:GNAT family N-acetyltransferase [Sporolactobacillus vineae]|uniref:GNAT family N-acetyltransferase n=1 Tax=Sporolactobacillus vineae TaxID=444463 RepID=UPI000287E11B|nr:GNAT family N-acetyltransferase [Sporolactobacillus vineae]